MVLKVTNTDPNAQDQLIGQQVGASYKIVEPLGSGGMGLVYLAESTKIGGSTKLRGKYQGKLAAVKVLTAQSKEAIARFRAEAYAAGKIDKFSVVDILDTGELATGQSYILMEYCDGGSLHDLREQRGFEQSGPVQFPYDEILSILSPVCAALVKAHEANLVHRDIKPHNILFVRNGKVLRARLSDFGLVKLREHDAFLMTARNAVMGTPGYMSPEQCVDTGTVDGRSDIYSVGCVLYQLLTGRLPYLGSNANDLIRQAKENAPIAPPSVFRRNLPPGWEQATMRCLAFQREERFQTALEVINSLADGLENGRSLMGFHAPILIEDVALGPTANTITSAAGGPAAKVWTLAQSAVHQRERSLQRRSLAMFIAGVAFGAVATGAIALTMRSEDNATAPLSAPPSPSGTELASQSSTPTTQPPASSTSAPVPARPPASSTSAPVSARPPASSTSAPMPAQPPASSTSAPVSARPPASSTSAPSAPSVKVTSEAAATSVVAAADSGAPSPEPAGSAATQAATREAIAPAPHISANPPRPTTGTSSPVEPAPSRAPTRLPRPVDVSTAAPTARTSTPSDASSATEAWVSIRVKGFAEISIDGDTPSTSPRRKRVRPGVHHVVMTGYPDGSDQQQRKEFDVIVPPGKDDDTVIFKTW